MEILDNTTEEAPKDELGELNAELDKLLKAWKLEYKTTTNENATPMQKRYVAKGPINAFLDKHFTNPDLELAILVSATDENLEALDEYVDKVEKGEDFEIVVPGYKFSEGNTNDFIVANGETELTLLPNALQSMRFVRKG